MSLFSVEEDDDDDDDDDDDGGADPRLQNILNCVHSLFLSSLTLLSIFDDFLLFFENKGRAAITLTLLLAETTAALLFATPSSLSPSRRMREGVDVVVMLVFVGFSPVVKIIDGVE